LVRGKKERRGRKVAYFLVGAKFGVVVGGAASFPLPVELFEDEKLSVGKGSKEREDGGNAPDDQCHFASTAFPQT
jgi:hypothetical protein